MTLKGYQNTLLRNNLLITHATEGWMSIIHLIFSFLFLTRRKRKYTLIISPITYSFTKTYTMVVFWEWADSTSRNIQQAMINKSKFYHSLIRFIITNVPSLQFSPEYPGRHSHLPPTQMLLFWHGLLSHWSVKPNKKQHC